VTDSRDASEGIRRRRECLKCGVRFTTYEHVQGASLVVVKRDGRREDYSREKLLRSIRLACVKRPLPTGALEKLVDEIEASLQRLGKAEIASSVIGEMAIARLRELDRVAYIRYASVYRDFEDLDEFQQEIEGLQTALQAAMQRPLEGQLALIPSNQPPPPQPRSRRGRKPGITRPRKPAEDQQPAPA
jgi:transcriptional repressor NrdR